MQRPIAALLCSAAIVTAACGTASRTAAPSPPATQRAATQAPGTAPATSAPTGPPRPYGTFAWPTGFAEELADATYVLSPPFDLPMTIRIREEGWHVGHMNPVFIDLQRYDGVAVGGLPTRMFGFALPENVRSPDGPVAVAGLSPTAALDAITSLDSVESDERAPIELLGLAGERVDLHSDRGNNPIFGSAEGDFGMQHELDLRLVALPHDSRLLLVLVLAPVAELDDAWAQALPMLESVKLVE